MVKASLPGIAGTFREVISCNWRRKSRPAAVRSGRIPSRVNFSMPRVDHDMIEACRHGDREALRILYEAYKDRVYSIALYFLYGDASAARDLTQTVFLKLLTRMEQFRYQSEFSTWLYRVVANACMDDRRKNRRVFSLEDVAPSQEIVKDGLERQQMKRELTQCVQRAIAELRPKLRIVVLLKYFEDLSYQEMAAVLNCSVGTVASRLNRGHKLLGQKLAHLRKESAVGD